MLSRIVAVADENFRRPVIRLLGFRWHRYASTLIVHGPDRSRKRARLSRGAGGGQIRRRFGSILSQLSTAGQRTKTWKHPILNDGFGDRMARRKRIDESVGWDADVWTRLPHYTCGFFVIDLAEGGGGVTILLVTGPAGSWMG
jgi:hypothetical protein